MPLFAATIFLGAFLLFQVQPLIGKYILPWFGGSPGVWTTCLLFFQTLLLGGYAYAHVVSTLPLRRQWRVHLVLLAVALAWLPVIPNAAWQPAPGQDPVVRILLLLAMTLGVPYLVLSATGPLLQRWFSVLYPGIAPYRLYALSNAGSLLALLSYPFLVEPHLSRPAQAIAWSAGFAVFAVLGGVCAWRLRAGGAGTVFADGIESDAAPGSAPPATAITDTTGNPTVRDRVMWVLLPAVASLLLVATTNKLCLDVAVVPFLWVLPLAAYLLSFILCFDHPRWYSRRIFSAGFAAATGGVCYLLSSRSTPLPVQVAAYGTMLFAGCMVCHGEAHRLRPAPRYLTEFYLSLAAGGALGGMAVALVAPLVFRDYRELQLGLVLLVYLIGVTSLLYRSRSLAVGPALGALAIPFVVPALRALTSFGLVGWLVSYGHEWLDFQADHAKEILAGVVGLALPLAAGGRIGAGAWRRRMSAAPLLLAVLLGMVFIMEAARDRRHREATVRNFYGVLKLGRYGDGDGPPGPFHLLSHGETTHGMQFVDAPVSRLPTTYYGATSGVGRALDLLPGPRRVGLVGLGAGTLACYGRPGDVFRFYEINPAIVALAHDPFTYLRDSAATIELAPGDARLVLEDELRRGAPQGFDVLVLDAFSSDAIPVHLLTREALALYLRVVRPGGLIAIHISNRYLDLRPVVEALARDHGLFTATIEDRPPPGDFWLYRTTWMLVTRDHALLERPDIRRAASEPWPADGRLVDWTDDHASLFDVVE